MNDLIDKEGTIDILSMEILYHANLVILEEKLKRIPIENIIRVLLLYRRKQCPRIPLHILDVLKSIVSKKIKL